MGFNFNFRQIGSTRDVGRLADFISAQNLGYPNYDSWVQRAEAELYAGGKKAVIAFSDETLVGDAIYQGHKYLQEVLEVKNLRVHPNMRLRSFARFMLKQVEVEGSRLYKAVLVDTRPERKDILELLRACGYTPIVEGPLYDPNQKDITFMKPLKEREKGILTIGRKFIEGRLL